MNAQCQYVVTVPSWGNPINMVLTQYYFVLESLGGPRDLTAGFL